MKKNEIKEMTYRELCQMFNEEVKKGGKAKTEQFSRWRKSYSIEKLEGKNLYKVKPLSTLEKALIPNSATSYLKQLRKIVFDYLTKHDHIVTSIEDLMEEFYLVNENFFNNGAWFVKTNTGFNDVENYKVIRNEIKRITTQAIRGILHEMQNSGIILLYEAFEIVIDKGDNVEETKIIEKDDNCVILRLRNEFTKDMFGSDYYERLNLEEKCEVNERVNKELGLKYHRSILEIYSDPVTIERLLKKGDVYLTGKEDAKIMNELSQLKVLTSNQGKLKELDDLKRLKLSNSIIKREDL